MASGNWSSSSVRQAIKNSLRVFSHPYFDIKVAPSLHSTGRLLVITPRRSGNAVKRNVFRRRIRALFHELQVSTKGHDWIFFAKPGIANVSFATLHTALVKSLASLSDNPAASSSQP